MHKWKTCNKVWICHFVVYYSFSFSFPFHFLSHLWFMKSWRVVGEGVLSFPSLDGCVFKDTVRTASWSYACACMSVFLWIEIYVSKKINKYLQYSVLNFSNLLIRIQGLLAQNWKRRKGDFYFLITKQLINQLIIEDLISYVWDFYWLLYDLHILTSQISMAYLYTSPTPSFMQSNFAELSSGWTLECLSC